MLEIVGKWRGWSMFFGSEVEFYDAAYAASGEHLLCCKHLLPSFFCLLVLKIHFQRFAAWGFFVLVSFHFGMMLFFEHCNPLKCFSRWNSNAKFMYSLINLSFLSAVTSFYGNQVNYSWSERNSSKNKSVESVQFSTRSLCYTNWILFYSLIRHSFF